MFVVCACARHQVTHNKYHLHDVKRIFRYLKVHPKLGLWYLKETPFDLVAYSYSDYGGATQDRKSTTGGCQFLGRRLISWQRKKQTIVATSTTKAKYVAAASGCGQVLWIQNQMLDYEYNFMNTKIYIDNNSAICIVKNPVYHSKTKHIEIRHHFIRDCYEKNLISEDHIHTDDNVVDLLTKPFDVQRFQYLVGEGSAIPTEPHHTPSPQAQQSPHHDSSSQLHTTATTEPIPTATPIETPTLRKYSRRATQIDQTKALSTAADEPARIKLLEDKDRGSVEPSGDDAPIKGRSLEIGEKVRVERSTKLGSNDTKEIVNVLSSMEAANILTSEVVVVSVPPVTRVSTVGVPTVSRLVPTVSSIFTTSSMEEIARENQRMNEKLARDAEIARLHAEEELKMTIKELTIREKIDLINEHVKYQDHHAKILKYQAQQSKLLSKKEQREFYMSVLRSHARWKTKHFRGMTLEEIKDNFIPVWKQIEDFVPMASKEEGERVKRKGLKLEHGSAKKMKTSEDVFEEDLKEMMQLVPVEELDKEDLHQLWALVKETLSIRQALRDKEMELWVELKRLSEPDFKDQLWTHTKNLMHDPLDWKLYDTCGVHHVFIKDQGIFMLVERNYPLRRGLAIVMISNKLQVENNSQMANDLILKIHNIAKNPR
nr:putative ribonuclease H-like domain-containing protein [Tanacetum cinerariifolium]